MSFDEQPDGDIHGECAFEIHSLQQQLASCQAALADTEALEIGTGERLAKVEQQLAASQAVIEGLNGRFAKDQERIACQAQKLAAALAACKLKDEALSKIEYLESSNGSILSAGECSSIATEALAITINEQEAA